MPGNATFAYMHASTDRYGKLTIGATIVKILTGRHFTFACIRLLIVGC